MAQNLEVGCVPNYCNYSPKCSWKNCFRHEAAGSAFTSGFSSLHFDVKSKFSQNRLRRLCPKYPKGVERTFYMSGSKTPQKHINWSIIKIGLFVSSLEEVLQKF